MGKPNIFGIGKPKTGSNSLKSALEIIGFKTYHTGNADKENDRSFHNQLLVNMQQNESPLKHIDCDYDCFVDYPIHAIYKNLYEENKDARFILTYRPPDDVALSWIRMMHHKKKPLPNRLPTNFSEFSQSCRDHVSEVFEFFLDKSKSLLILDTRDSDATKWKLLCKFLDVANIPTKKFPHSFNHASWELKK